MFVKAAQFLVYREHPHRWFGDDGFGTQNNEKMPQCSTQALAILTGRPRTFAMRQMNIKEPPDRGFVDPMNVQAGQIQPARKVRNAAEILTDDASRVTTLNQVVFVRINVWR